MSALVPAGRMGVCTDVCIDVLHGAGVPWDPSKAGPHRFIIGISASPTSCPSRGYGRAGTQNDRRHAHPRAMDMPSAMPRCL